MDYKKVFYLSFTPSIRFRLFSLLLLISLTSHNHAQSLISSNSITKGKIYAVIIGISDYKDENIKDLRFAHRDAEIFAEYLTSPAGGSVPKEQIKLLTNENATISNIYIAKQWLETSAQKDDLVFFYFSGHGDVESSIYKLGFLLAYDTPQKNYLNNAVRIEDINIMANTLSIEKNVNTILITDACHSGKLAGSDNRGTALIGEQLSKVEKNEIRIASCEAEQLSQEDEAWGGGRGVFSYYLINGLKGLADAGDEDGIITLQELSNYIELKVSTDVSNLKQEEQIPVVKGKNLTKMAIVDEDELMKIKTLSTSTNQNINSQDGSKSVDFVPSVMDNYFNNLSKTNLKDGIDFEDWNHKSNEEVTDLAIEKFEFSFNDDSESDLWRSKLKTDMAARKEYQQRLAALIHSEAQKAINAYLTGDKEEMERRQYYNANNNEFEEYAEMLEVAMKLIQPNTYLHHIMEVKYHYFRGVAARLKMVITLNRDSLRSIAFDEQQKALALEQNAAYIQNELGILYFQKNENEKAKQHYLRACELVPTWAIPRSNLSNLYLDSKEYELGLAAAQKAISIQNDYPGAYTNLARNAEATGNYLVAEEGFRKAIKYNDKNYLPFEQLAYVYTNTTEYEAANLFFIEADKRKRGFFPLGLTDVDQDGVVDLLDQELNSPSPCQLDVSKFGSLDIMAILVYGYENFANGNYDIAEEYFKKAIRIDQGDPIAFRYMGELMYKKNRWAEAELYFDIAQNNYLPLDAFKLYVKDLIKKQKYTDCLVESRYENLYYEEDENYFFLGDIYTQWGYYLKAESIYKEVMIINPGWLASYQLLWELYEKRGQYLEAEKMIKSYYTQDADITNQELIGFYERMINRNIDKQDYYYKAGLLLYHLCDIEEDTDYDVPDDDRLLIIRRKDELELEEIPQYIPESGEYTVSGTNKKLYRSGPISYPNEEAINYFLKIKTSASDTIKKAEIYYRLGELYSLKSDNENSKRYFQRSTDLYPNDASIKRKLIKKNIYDFEYSNAYKELGYLYDSDQINFNGLLLFGKYSVLSGELEKGKIALEKADLWYPYYVQLIPRTMALKFLFGGQFDKAIEVYKDMIGPIAQENKDIYYSISRIYALENSEDQAISYLSKAIDAGFSYNWVLDKDTALDKLRASSQWNPIRSKLPATAEN